jgi:spermidine synthase
MATRNRLSGRLPSLMSTQATLARATPPCSPPVSGAIIVGGVGLSSFAALLLELSLTRVFSVVLFYHFAFLAISIALLGLGAGGVFAHLQKTRFDRIELRRLATICTSLTAATIPLVLETVLHVPVSIDLTRGNFLRLTVLYTCSAIPFIFTGVEFAVLFARLPERISRLYGADLAGGALACLAAVPLLNGIGGPNAILFSAVAAGAAAWVWSPNLVARRGSAVLSSVLLLAMMANHSGRIADIIWAKGVRRNNVEFSRWNAISRVEVDRQGDGARVIVIDADANTFIMNADPQKWTGSEWQARLMATPPAVVNLLRPHGDYAVIGPGGGVDILRALGSGSHSVTGIEINPIIADTIMRGRYADFAYHLYERPPVHIYVGDGRAFIRNAQQRFDVIEMTLVDTWASTAAGAFALSENNLYTTQAFREFFEHLKPDGILGITRWEFQRPREALRVASVAINALRELGVSDSRTHFIVVSEKPLDRDGINVAVLAKATPFTTQEEEIVRQQVAANPPMEILYSPSHRSENPFTNLIDSNDPYRFSQKYPYNVEPVSDSAPFFFFTMKPRQLLDFGSRSAMDWKVNLGIAVLAMLLVISVAAVLAFLITPLILKPHATKPPPALLYFVVIGLGYILVEITFVQRFVLFLGHPTYALTVVVFLMLLASGAGSAISKKWIAKPGQVWLPLAIITSVVIAYVRWLPNLLDHMVGARWTAKLAISGLVLAPLAFVMGTPFPVGLKALADRPERQGNLVEWAWAMNAAASVLGSVLAMVIGIQFGFDATLGCGGAAYLAALLLRRKLLPTRSRA